MNGSESSWKAEWWDIKSDYKMRVKFSKAKKDTIMEALMLSNFPEVGIIDPPNRSGSLVL